MISVQHSWAYYFQSHSAFSAPSKSVAGNLTILSSAVDPLVESHVLNWFWSCCINLRKTPSAWFHSISDGVKTIDVSPWEIVVIVAQRVIVFVMDRAYLSQPAVSGGTVKLVSLEFVKYVPSCFHCTPLVFICHCVFSRWSALRPTCSLKALFKGIRHDSDWWWQTVLILYRGVISGRLHRGFRWQ